MKQYSKTENGGLDPTFKIVTPVFNLGYLAFLHAAQHRRCYFSFQPFQQFCGWSLRHGLFWRTAFPYVTGYQRNHFTKRKHEIFFVTLFWQLLQVCLMIPDNAKSARTVLQDIVNNNWAWLGALLSANYVACRSKASESRAPTLHLPFLNYLFWQ